MAAKPTFVLGNNRMTMDSNEFMAPTSPTHTNKSSSFSNHYNNQNDKKFNLALSQIISQLDTLTQTVAILEQRLTNVENKLSETSNNGSGSRSDNLK